MKWLICLLALAALLATGCNTSVYSYCAKYTECKKKDCDYTDEACNAKYRTQQDRCNNSINDNLDSIRTGNSEYCETCAQTWEKYYECAGAQESCSAFDDLDDCEDEAEDVLDDCKKSEEKCLE